ncbi:MAG: hypothetical protein KF802_06265 [Bdellovibrionaceae bacterium]|nr:hypothetical protein [Pseudobdellovibrionaceae bacterium]MBX3032526.1 hypothetical protein [Pseudobdellovibrionaceae bacterium]
MRLFFLFSFLTLVGISAPHAAPNPGIPRPAPPGTREEAPPAAADETRLEDLRLAEPPGVPQALPDSARRRPPLAPRADQHWQVNTGLLGGAYLDKNKITNFGFIGVQWRRGAEIQSTWDFALDLTTTSVLHFSCGRRYPWGYDGQFAPYWKLALSQTVPSDEFFGGLTNLERVKAVGALGLGDLRESSPPWNAEFALGWGMRGPGFQLRVGRGF